MHIYRFKFKCFSPDTVIEKDSQTIDDSSFTFTYFTYHNIKIKGEKKNEYSSRALLWKP